MMESAETSRAKKFIFDALHLDPNLPSPDSSQRMHAEDWDYVSKIAKMHRLGPMLHHKLVLHADDIPHMVRDQLKASQYNSAIRNLKIYRELVKVTRILNEKSIPSIALKGAYLARFAYPDVGLRPMRDLDFLIKQEKIIDAFELLKSFGYEQKSDGGLPEAYFKFSNDLPSLVSPEGISIELHHRLISDAHLEFSTDSDDALWARSISKEIGGTQVRFLVPEDLLLHLCIHATHHHQFNLGPLALTDIGFLVESHQIDWEDFFCILSRGNWQRCALSLLHLARIHIGAKIPEEVIAYLGGADVDSAWQKSAEYLLFSDLREHKLMNENIGNFMNSRSLFAKISLLIGTIFPDRSVIARDYPVRANSAVAFLHYPRRWYRLISEKMPILLQMLAGRKKGLRHLATHWVTYVVWLQEKPK
jgi:hypothetical protein